MAEARELPLKIGQVRALLQSGSVSETPSQVSARRMERRSRVALLELVEAVRRDDLGSAAALWGLAGYDPEGLACLGDDLGSLIRLIFRPFAGEGLFDVAYWRLSEAVDERLSDGSRLAKEGLAPQRLLHLEDGEQHVEAWLE